MKNAALFATLLAFLVISVNAQGERKTRPRVVTNPKTAEKQYPTIKNDTRPVSTDRSKPVLIDNSRTKPTTVPTPPPLNPETVEEDDVIEIETNYVTLPVTVLDRQGRFISGLSKNDFKIYEDGVLQKVEVFDSVEKPFTVVLLIDTSPSTKYKIDEIHNAAITFVRQLRPQDRVMVVAFNQNYRVLTYPTSDQYRLESAIRRTSFGGGTSLYDAVSRTIDNELRQIDGRKAVVLFTDGVDTTSKRENYETTLRTAEEADALFYPIRYDTSGQYRSGIPRGRSRRGGGSSGGGILGKILERVITGSIRVNTGGTTGAGQSRQEYARGNEYLTDLARLTGGRKFDADTTYNLDSAFRSIAEELRRQYSLGYYPTEIGNKGARKRIKVRVRGRNLVVRTKRSYIVGEGK